MHRDPEDVATQWISAFNGRESGLDRLLTLYADDAVHVSPKLRERYPETNGEIKGKENLRIWWRDAFQRIPTLHYRLIRLTANEERVFMEYVREVAGETPMLIAEVLEIRDGLIHASRVYHG